MKKNVLQVAILALIAPCFSTYGLGLGNMTVKSALDQPFFAEIELIDVKSVALKDVRVHVASPENFEEIGLERAAILSLLSFKIDKNEQGKEIITVQSTERMAEPYIELVVDLAWPEGQLYKAYTILLDPPGYRLVTTVIQGGAAHYKQVKQFKEPGVIDKTIMTTVNHNPVTTHDTRKKSTYGPTVTNENIWQIAQRYKTSEVILPQIVLAIVGANPWAFNEGNLNSLKVGIRLTIPATEEVVRVPADLATAEAMAHDKAWNDKSAIEHVLTPPYISQLPESSTKLTNPETTNASLPSTLPQWIPSNTAAPGANNQVQAASQGLDNDARIKAELSITAAAIESVREANALLMEQLHELKKKNEELQKQLDERNQELNQVRSQIQVLIKERQAVAGATNTTKDSDNNPLWLYVVLLLAASGGAAFIILWHVQNQKRAKQQTLDDTSNAANTKTDNGINLKDAQVTESVPEGGSSTVLVPVAVDTMRVKEPDLPMPDNDPLHDVPRDVAVSISPPVLDYDNKLEPTEKKETVRSIPEPADVKENNTSLEFTAESITSKPEPDEAHNINLKTAKPINSPNSLRKNSEKDAGHPEQSEGSSRMILSAQNDEGLGNKDEITEELPAEFLEFESGLHTQLMPDSKEESTKEGEEPINGIDFILEEQQRAQIEPGDAHQEDNLIEVDDTLSHFFAENKDEADDATSSDELIKPANLKSKKALDTLLALAKTYVSMDDFESARHALQEVAEHGTKKQQEEATALLTSIKNKK